MEIFERLLDLFTVENLIFTVICDVIVALFVELVLKRIPIRLGLTKASWKSRLIGIGEYVGLFGMILTALIFILIHVLKLTSGYFSVEFLAKVFVHSMILFMALHILDMSMKVMNKERKLSLFIDGLGQIIFRVSTIVMFLLCFKIVSDFWSGMSDAEMEAANKDVWLYIDFAWKSLVYSGLYIFSRSIIGLIVKSQRKHI